MRVQARKSVHFPKLNWGINAGQQRELPEDKKAQELILSHGAITKVPASKKEEKSSS